MRHSLDQFTSILNIKPQINLQFMNTFFALSIASYYVVMHHTPQGLRWPSHLKLYEVQKDIVEEKRQLEEFSSIPQLSFVLDLQNASLPLLNKRAIGGINLIQSQSLENVIEENKSMQDLFSLNPSLAFQPSDTLIEDIHPMKIASQLGLQEKIFNFSPSSASLELPKIGTQENVITNAPLTPICTNKISIFENAISTPHRKKMNLDMGQVKAETSPVTHLSNDHPLQSQSLPTVNLPLSSLLVHSVLQEIDDVSTSYVETISTNTPLNSLSSISENRIVAELEEETGNSLRTVVEEATITNAPPLTHTSLDPLPCWSTYMLRVRSKSDLLRFWLMKLAPGGSRVKSKEIPFRRALIETLLSEEFQPHIGPNWEPPIGPGWEPSEEGEEDGNDDEDIKTRRRKFHDTYLKKIEWAGTRFKQLFLVDGSEDFHQVNEEAYLKAYNFPLKLGIRVYRDEDFCSEEG